MPTVQPGECFWIGFDPGSSVSAPMNAQGAPGVAQARYRRPNINGGAWTVFTVAGAEVAFRLRCTNAVGDVPVLDAVQLPRPGLPLQLDITQAGPFAPTFLVWALDPFQWNSLPAPVELTALGAPGCFVHTSSDNALLLLTDGQGTASFQTTLPGNPGLIGVTFYNQAAVVSQQNALGLIVSNRGEGVVGN